MWRGPGAVGVLWALSRAPGAPQMGAGDGVRAAGRAGLPPQFRDRPVCGKRQFTGLESTFFFPPPTGTQSCLSAVPEELEQPLEWEERRMGRSAPERRPGRELSTPGRSTAPGEPRAGRGSRMPVPGPRRRLPAPSQGRDAP